MDASAKMLEVEAARVRSGPVTWVQADLASHVPQQRHELAIQHFVLDCFDEAAVTALADRLAGSLGPGGCRLLADFRVPHAAPAAHASGSS